MRFCILSAYYYIKHTFLFKNKNLGAFLRDRMRFCYRGLILYKYVSFTEKIKILGKTGKKELELGLGWSLRPAGLLES